MMTKPAKQETAVLLRLQSLLVIVALIAPIAAWAQKPPYMHRGRFFENTPFGSLAWIDAANRTRAFGAEFVYDLSQSRCQSLPEKSAYWFLINHRNPSESQKGGFFAVRIVGRAATGTASEKVRVHRTDGWSRDDGKPLDAGPAETDRPIAIKDFVQLHDASLDNNPDDRLAKLTNQIGVWHARLTPDGMKSWDHRGFFGSSSHLTDGQGPVLLAGRLMSFTPTDSFATIKPNVFYINRGDFDTFWISIAAPNFDFDGTELEVRIGRNCNS